MDTREVEGATWLRVLLGYLLPAHVSVQDGSRSRAPTAVFADMDYEVGDGTCGLHERAKSANEPAIVYVRADALASERVARERAEAALEAIKCEGLRCLKVQGVGDIEKYLSEMGGLYGYGSIVKMARKALRETDDG